jgi:hypothetical protein
MSRENRSLTKEFRGPLDFPGVVRTLDSLVRETVQRRSASAPVRALARRLALAAAARLLGKSAFKAGMARVEPWLLLSRRCSRGDVWLPMLR